MRICQNCFQEFEDEAGATASPAEALGEIFMASVGGDDSGTQDTQDFCPACREKLGIVNILGFGS
jgi:hypothetical protein